MKRIIWVQPWFDWMKQAHRWLYRRWGPLLIGACAASVCMVAHGQETAGESAQIQEFTDEELRALVAPIALYPDALLAQILPATAYPVDVVAAYRHSQFSVESREPPAGTNWDSSIVALLHYPTVLKRMSEDVYWTERLGMAVTYQMSDVSETIQQVRAEAYAAGNLVSNDKQIVTQDRTIITIVPANPTVIYVPVYEPSEIYYRRDSIDPFISFGVGFGVGIWLSNSFDWRYHRIGTYNYWYGGSWRPRHSFSYWRAPYRSIPYWYSRGAYRTSFPSRLYGYRSGYRLPARRGTRTFTSSRTGRDFGTSRNSGRSEVPARHTETRRIPNAPMTHAEGIRRNRQQVRKETIRGAVSRRASTPARAQPERTAPPRSAPPVIRNQRPRPSQERNVLRPSTGSDSRRESQRGSRSRNNGSNRR